MSFFGKPKIPSSEEGQEVRNFRLQTSAKGVVIPVVFGTARIAGNLLWFGDYQAYATEEGGGKGAGSSPGSLSYAYVFSYLMGLCEGPIVGVRKYWADKGVYGQISYPAYYGLALGTYPQAAWTHLVTDHPTEAIPYPGIAYIYLANRIQYTSYLSNYNYEVQGFNIVATLDDANPADVVEHIVKNTKTGLGLCAGSDGVTLDTDEYRKWCLASGLLISPSFKEQRSALSQLTEILEETFSTVVIHDGSTVLLIPLADTAVTGNGETWTPNVTPVYDLGYDDFISDDDQDPVRITRKSPADLFNNLKIECLDRDLEYNTTLVEASDQGSIDAYVLRDAGVKRYPHICLPAIGRTLVQLSLQRGLYVKNLYAFRLGLKYQLLEPMDVVTLTDPGLGLSLYPVRIVSIDETEEGGGFDIVAEDFPAGIGHSALYQTEASSGAVINYNVDPGNVNTPLIFCPPGTMTAGRSEIWISLSGNNNNWGGADVHVSSDNSTYKFAGRASMGSRMGVLSGNLATGNDPDAVNTLPVNLTMSRGELLSVDPVSANRLGTLSIIKNGNNTEYVGYETATLTTQYNYNLTVLRRGQHGTAIQGWNANAQFARLSQRAGRYDESCFKLPLDPEWYGTQLYFKFCSVNPWDQALQAISEVSPYTFTPTNPMPVPTGMNATTAADEQTIDNKQDSMVVCTWTRIPKFDYLLVMGQADGNWEITQLVKDPGSGTTVTARVGGLKAGVTYYWKVRTWINDQMNSDQCAVQSILTWGPVDFRQFKNILLNPHGRICQPPGDLGSSFYWNDSQPYKPMMDGWYGSRGNTAGAVWNTAGTAVAGNMTFGVIKKGFVMTSGTFNTNGNANASGWMILSSKIEAQDAQYFSNRTISWQFTASQANNNNWTVYSRLISPNATADDWSDIVAGNAYSNQIGNNTPTVCKVEGVNAGNVDLGFGLEVYAYLGTGRTSLILNVTDFQLELGAKCSEIEVRTIAQEIALAQRQIELSVPAGVRFYDNPTTGVNGAAYMRTQANSNYHAFPTIPFKVRKRVAPAITLANPLTSNTANDIRNVTDSTDHPAYVQQADELGLVVGVNNSNIGADKYLAVHWMANSRL